ncbi:MAG: hypothetical protein PHE88_01745 [Elusimicrobia bacterium]|nr:hypothetical protein [Elusimicrobiota bacterium]
MKRLNLMLLSVGLMVGLGINHAGAVANIGGTLDINYPVTLSGGEPQEGFSSIWVHELDDRDFMLTHFHPIISADISDKVKAESMICIVEAHPATVWNAFVDYTPYLSKKSDDNPVTIRIGRFFVPFGYFNENYANPVDLKTISRPLMYVDHDQEDMQLNGGPQPIFMTPYFDTGILLFGIKSLREKDQLWYGVYMVNGMHYEEDHFDAPEMSRLNVEWETEVPPHDDLSKNKQVGTRITYSMADIFTVGASYFTGKYDEKSQLSNTVSGADLYVPLSKANLRFEYAQNPIEWIDSVPGMTSPEDFYTLGTKKKYTKKGWYTQFDFPFDLIFKESEAAKKFEFAAMYSVLEGARTKVDDMHTFDKMSRIATAITFMPDLSLKYKIEYQYTPLSGYNATSTNVATYGDKIENLSRIQMSAGMSF